MIEFFDPSALQWDDEVPPGYFERTAKETSKWPVEFDGFEAPWPIPCTPVLEWD